jgi:HEAT repeat protein
MFREDKIIQNSLAEEEVDLQALQKVKELILSLSNTVSALKIFPSHHESSLRFRQDLITKLKSFFERYQKLELEIGEFAFYHQGKQVYQDEVSSKSLPYFFYKDGMRLLIIYNAVEEEEIRDILELIKTESAKPADESDIVNAMWTRDFSNIRYYVPEEFVQNKILEERTESLSRKGLKIETQELASKILDIKVNKEKLFSGRLELKPEEKKAMEFYVDQDLPEITGDWQWNFDPEKLQMQRTPSEPSTVQKKLPQEFALNEQDLQQLNQMIEKNRQLSPEEEFLNLMTEILALEEDSGQLKTNLDILYEFYQENLKAGNFRLNILLSKKMKDLRDLLSSEENEKIPLLTDFINRISDIKDVDEIRKLIAQKLEINYSALFEYLSQFQDKALPFFAEFFDKIEDESFRQKVKGLFETKIQSDAGKIVALVDDRKPLLTEFIIDIMRQQPARKILPHFINFMSLYNKTLKIKAIEAVSSFEDEMANKILLGFLNDPQEEVRLKAMTSLKFLGDIARLKQLMEEISTKKFRKKNFQEKKTMFEFLGRTRSEEALAFLKQLFLKKSIMPSTTELRVCAVAGLEAMGTEVALEPLRRGKKFFNRRVRRAAVEALARLETTEKKG